MVSCTCNIISRLSGLSSKWAVNITLCQLTSVLGTPPHTCSSSTTAWLLPSCIPATVPSCLANKSGPLDFPTRTV